MDPYQIVPFPIHPPCTPWDCYHIYCAKPPIAFLVYKYWIPDPTWIFEKLVLPVHRTFRIPFQPILIYLCNDAHFGRGHWIQSWTPYHAADGRWPAQSEWGGIYPCAFCDLLVDWSDLAVQCDECDVWHHKSCIEMPTCEYDHIENVSWKCYKCKSTNCSSFLYQAYNLNESNSFDALAGIPGDDSVFANIVSPSRFPENPPLASSSPADQSDTQRNQVHVPKFSSASTCDLTSRINSSSILHCSKPTDNLRILVANMNSIKNRKAEITHLCNTVAPDVILACETKVDNTIKSTEFLPAHYTGHIRRDRTYHGGGVMICHKKELVIDEIDIIEEKPGETTHHDEIVWAKLTIRNASPVYIGSYYRPSSNFSSDSITFLKRSRLPPHAYP